MQHDALPFRFRTAPGWPQPSDDWVARHPLVEPAPGWTPAPGTPPAPDGWVFWRTDRRALRAFLPPSARGLVVVRAVGAVLALLGLVAGIVASVAGSVLAFAVLPVLIAGVAMVVVAGARLLDVRAATIRQVTAIVRPDDDDPASDSAWDVPGAAPFRAADRAASDRRLRRSGARALALLSGAAALVLVAGVSAAAVPTSRALVDVADRAGVSAAQQGGQDDGSGTQGTAPDDGSSGQAAPDDGTGTDHGDGWKDPQPFVTRDGAVTIAFLGDDESTEATCGTVGDADQGCWSWYATGECDGQLAVTIGFSATEDGAETRTVHRTLDVSKATPAAFVETGSEQYAAIEDAACTDTPPRSPMGITDKTALDPGTAAGTWPVACDDLGCAGWTITSDQSCADAQAVYRVDDPVGILGGPHAVAVESPVVAGRPVTIYVAGVLDQDEAQLEQLTCR